VARRIGHDDDLRTAFGPANMAIHHERHPARKVVLALVQKSQGNLAWNQRNWRSG
jgi:hypothetical protein